MSWPKGKPRPVGEPSPPNRSSGKKLTEKGKEIRSKVRNKSIKLNDDEKIVVDRYTTDAPAINKLLRDKTIKDKTFHFLLSGPGFNVFKKDTIGILDNTIKKYGKSFKGKTLYRGYDLNAKNKVFNKYNVGDIIQDKGFLSVTSREETAKKWSIQDMEKSGGYMKIKIIGDSKGLEISKLRSKRFARVYDEIVFSRESKLKIKSKTYERIGNTKRLIIEAEML